MFISFILVCFFVFQNLRQTLRKSISLIHLFICLTCTQACLFTLTLCFETRRLVRFGWTQIQIGRILIVSFSFLRHVRTLIVIARFVPTRFDIYFCLFVSSRVSIFRIGARDWCVFFFFVCGENCACGDWTDWTRSSWCLAPTKKGERTFCDRV